MTIYLVRHGQDNDTVRGGWSSQPLTQEGQIQAEALAKKIMQERDRLAIEHIYSSDLPRAMQTAEPIAQCLGLPVIPAPQFREVNNGDLAGMNNTLAIEKFPGIFWNQLKWEQAYPNGESPRDFYERIKFAWEDLIEDIRDNAVLVTHSGVIQVILSVVEHYPYSNMIKQPVINYCQMITVEGDNHGTKVLRSLR